MDHDRFDHLARLLGAGTTRRVGLRAALGAIGLLGAGLAAGTETADAARNRAGDGRRNGTGDATRKRRKTCRPACAAGFDCVKQGRKRRCVCSTGVTCAGACCPTGQVCRNGACAEPVDCIAPGQPCKGVGAPCCDGRTCASGQGGEADVACHVPKTGACADTADCVFGTSCVGGRCQGNVPAPAPLGETCDAGAGQVCATPGAVCTPYSGAGAPAGTHCSLPLRAACTANPDCTCYRCDVPAGVDLDSRGLQAPSARACCGPEGHACQADPDCCAGLACTTGTCQAATCDVCASGCAYSSIKAAYDALDGGNPVFPAGGTIKIAPGTYFEPGPVVLDRNMTFRRCGESGAVVWTNPDNAPFGNDDWYEALLLIDDGPVTSLSLFDIEFTATPDINGYPTSLMEFGSADSDSDSDRRRVVAERCTWRDFTNSTGSSGIDMESYIDLELTDCTFSNLSLDSNGAGINAGSDGTALTRSTITLTRCTFTGNTANFKKGGAINLENVALTATGSSFTGNLAQSGGGAISLQANNDGAASATLTDCTLSGNTADAPQWRGGGAIWVDVGCTLALAGTTTVTGNTTVNGLTPDGYGSGIRVKVKDYDNPASLAPGRITGTTTSNVSGNTPVPDCQVWATTSSSGTPQFAVSCSGWCVVDGSPCNASYTTCCNPQSVCVSGVCGQQP